jgi:hypothetical protein
MKFTVALANIKFSRNDRYTRGEENKRFRKLLGNNVSFAFDGNTRTSTYIRNNVLPAGTQFQRHDNADGDVHR